MRWLIWSTPITARPIGRLSRAWLEITGLGANGFATTGLRFTLSAADREGRSFDDRGRSPVAPEGFEPPRQGLVERADRPHGAGHIKGGAVVSDIIASAADSNPGLGRTLNLELDDGGSALRSWLEGQAGVAAEGELEGPVEGVAHDRAHAQRPVASRRLLDKDPMMKAVVASLHRRHMDRGVAKIVRVQNGARQARQDKGRRPLSAKGRPNLAWRRTERHP
ncbi:hypothetical protein LTR94_025741 [Friedmanniomyces endolithicus]|nr:hypothetical protein LTR94_025741 [Friedmanniomyces endolithicus]